jgi:oligosaccharide repeat unit polymerase
MPGLWLLNLAIGCVCAGYLAPPVALDRNFIPPLAPRIWSRQRLFFVCSGLAALALLGIVLFVQRVGLSVDGLAGLSGKRKLVVAGAAFKFAALGYHRWLASLMTPAFFLAYAAFAVSGARWRSGFGAAVAFIGMLALAFPIMTSSRSSLLIILLYSIVVWHFTRRSVRFRTIAVAGMAAVLLFSVILLLRRGVSDVDEMSAQLNTSTIAEAVLANRQFVDVTKVAHIVEAVPSRLERQYGATLAQWLVLPIPRTMWAGKPVGTDWLVAQRVYQWQATRGGGIPPSYFGELFINFGWAGVVVGSLLLGILMRTLWETFRASLSNDPIAVLTYVILAIHIGFTLPSADLSRAILFIVRDIGVVLLVVPFIGPRRRQPPAAVA